MKLKRFLALVVSLAMVLSIVPAFSLTASAADEIVLFDVDNLTISGEQTVQSSTSGWTSSTTNNGAIRWNQGWGSEGTGTWGAGTGTYAMMIFNWGLSADATVTASYDNASVTSGASKVTVEFNVAAQTTNDDLYHYYYFRDIDGTQFARVNIDNGIGSNSPGGLVEVGFDNVDVATGTTGILGTNIKIVAEKNTSGTYTVTYYVEGVSKQTETVDSINGFGSIYAEVGRWNTRYGATGLQDLRITYEMPETTKTINVTYTVDGETVGTDSKTIDTSETSEASFDAYYYSANGSNVMYEATANSYSEDTTIAMTAVENWSGYDVGTQFTNNDIPYITTSTNLIPNGNFAEGINGWYAADGSAASSSNFTTNADAGSVYIVNSAGSGSAYSLQRSWAIESGKTYAFVYTQDSSADGKKWQRFCLGNDFANNNDAMLLGAGTNDEETGQSVVQGLNLVVFTNTDGYAYANFRAGYSGGVTFSNFGLYEVEIDTSQAIEYKIVATGSVSDTTTYYAVAEPETVPIPHYDGHIMKSRSISGTTITVTYEATETSIGSWYMRNNFTDDNWLTQSKYIGSHNAFADDDSVFDNEGGALYGDTGATNSGTTAVDNSRTQSVGVVDQLNAGVRYFDIRLSRQSDGTFAVVHGPAFENFRDVAISMTQWAKENPGEVIILDFQTVRDALYDNETYTVVTDNDSYYGPGEGDDNQYVYDALVQLFEDTGLADYMQTNWDHTYGWHMTQSGGEAVIIPFGKSRAVNCQGGYFVNRSALNNDITYNVDDPAADYDEAVSYIDSTYTSITGGATISTVHAYSTPVTVLGIGDSLLEAALDNNPNWINETNFYNWMAYDKGDVLLMNDSVSDIDLYYEALNKFNRTGSSYSYTADFTRTTNNVTIIGAQEYVPFSTKWTVTAGDASAVGTLTISGTEYTPVTAYSTALMQFNTNSVQPTGSVTLTFPQVSNGVTTVDVLLSSDGSEVLATAGVGEAITYSTTSLGNYILATKVAPGVNVTVQYVDGSDVIMEETKYVVYNQVAYTTAAGDFYITNGEEAFIVNSTTATTYTVTESDVEDAVLKVDVTLVHENAVLQDTFGNSDGSADCNNTTNLLFVGSSGVSDAANTDADGVATYNGGGNVGSPRVPVIMFNVPSVGANQAVKLNLYVAQANQNLGTGNWMKLAANTVDFTVDETVGYDTDNYANTSDIVWSDQSFTQLEENDGAGRHNVNSWVTIDVTEFVKEATGDTITFALYAPTAGAYVADREKAVANGAYQGLAAYLDVVDAYTVTVGGASKITKNGNAVDSTTEVTAYEGATIKLYETSSETPAFTNGTKVYATDNTTGETAYITVTGDDTYYAATTGLVTVDGAQVRIGDGVDGDGKVSTGSGLRFITMINGTDTLAGVDGATFGVEITAEGSEADPVVIAADKWQNSTTYTSALTNLAVSNYNRKFTSTPYVTVDGQTFYGTPVERSIYQVAAGLLATGYNGNYGESAEPENGTDYTNMSDILVKVLNAYVNQVGIRLSLIDADSDLIAHDADSASEKGGKYTGDAFFTVESASHADGVYTVVLKPVGQAEINMDYWNEYVRINNNNSVVSLKTTLTKNTDGTYTLEFNNN